MVVVAQCLQRHEGIEHGEVRGDPVSRRAVEPSSMLGDCALCVGNRQQQRRLLRASQLRRRACRGAHSVIWIFTSEIGRASCRERVEKAVGGGSVGMKGKSRKVTIKA